MADRSTALTREQVSKLTPSQVHSTLKRVMLVDGFDLVYDMNKSHGAYIHDARTGKDYLDFFSFFASWPVSHNHPAMKDPEFLQQIGHIACFNPSNSDIYTVEMAQFVSTFERVAMPPEFKHLFLVSGGSLAVENALKAAMDWKVRKNIAAGRGERGQKIIHFKEAFHGRSGYSLSLTNTDPRKYLYFPLFKDWPRVENPKAIFPLEGENLQKTIEAEQRSLMHIKAILEAESVEIAAIILEPVQGEGGDHHFRPEFWQALRKLADQYEVMLIADEVQAGMGLTGKFWSWQHYGCAPDLMTFGKKAQVCGFMATSRIDEVKDNVFQVPSRINSTWGGSLVDMVRSRKILEIIEEEKLVENAATLGAYMLERLQELSNKYPDRIMNVRGKGFMAAFNLPSPQHCTQLKALAYERGALIISCGTRGDVIRLRPVLDTKKEDVEKLAAILDECFEVMGPVSLLPKDSKH